ncbi:MAG: GAF domain-containing protein [Opitutaceae bacterium]|nr:GAF domain-containing protein [Opitutaceae bacterium]
MEFLPEPDILPALYRIAALATGPADHAAVAHEALTAITESMRADAGALLLLNPESNRLEFETSRNLDLGPNAPGLELGQGLPGWSALHAQPVLAARVETDHRYRPLRDATRCQMAAPLLVEEHVIGIIVLDHDQTEGFSTAALTRLVHLADEASRVLRRVGRLKQLEDKAGQLETLISAGRVLVGKLAPQELFESITRDACRLLGGRSAALYLCDDSLSHVRCVALHTPVPLAPPPGDMPVSSCLVAATVRTSRQTEFSDIQSPEFRSLADLPADPALRSVLITPLIYERDVLGVLALFSERVQRFDNDAKRLCAGLANLGAVAFENARLYSRVFQSEETLRKNEQLTTLGLLAAEIAHEIRNPLTVLKLLHGGLGLDFPEDDPRRTDMRVISEKLDQLEAIVMRVLQFGKSPSSSLHSRWALVDIVNDTLVLVRLKLAQAKIRLRFETPGVSPIVEGHKGQLQQVLLNLILNSTHAMPDGGTITLAVGTRDQGGIPCATLDLSDTGNGIPPAIANRIFDSFLSGRPDGTGLGLAIAKRILLSHRGDIALASTGPEGTTMRVTLPLAH